LLVPQGCAHQFQHEVVAQSLQSKDSAAGAQSGIDFKPRILGCRPYQSYRRILHEWQDGVLLGLVESVDLINEEDGSLAIESLQFAGRFDLSAKVSHT
jgi:hypothetical protein